MRLNMVYLLGILLGLLLINLLHAQFIPLECPSSCTLVTVDMSYTQCQCDSEISTSCLVNFGWYDDIETPCQFASSKTDEFSVTLMWNCYKDCGGSTSPPCEYFNGTWMYSEFDDRQLKKPFTTNAYTFKGDSKTAHHLFVKSSEISGTARVLVSPVYARKP